MSEEFAIARHNPGGGQSKGPKPGFLAPTFDMVAKEGLPNRMWMPLLKVSNALGELNFCRLHTKEQLNLENGRNQKRESTYHEG